MLCTSCTVRLTATIAALLFCAVAPLACAVAPQVRSSEAATGKGVEAIWHVQSLPFRYNSVHANYACDSLEKKIRVILQAVGAHKSMVVRARCVGHDLLSTVSVHIALATPVEATEENIRAATTFDSRDELVARLQKIRLPTPTDISRFPATWQTISLPRQPQLHLDVGDCDLLRHMNEQIFPKLAVRLVHEEPYCNASATRFRPRFEVQALIAAPVNAVAQTPPPSM